MAGVRDYNGIILYLIGIVPFVGVSHIIPFPTGQCGFASLQCLFYFVYGKEGVADIPLHIFIGVGMLVFAGNVNVKRPDFLKSPGFDNICVRHYSLP